MVSNREARAMGYVDKIHYKHYPYMSADEYIKKFGGNGKQMNNDPKMADFRNKNFNLFMYFAETLEEGIVNFANAGGIDNLAFLLKTIETQLSKLKELKNEVVNINGLSPIVQRYREEFIKLIKIEIRRRESLKDTFNSGSEDFSEFEKLCNEVTLQLNKINEIQKKAFIME